MVNKKKWIAGALSSAALTMSSGCEDQTELNRGVLDGELINDDERDFTPVDDSITFRSVNDNGQELNGAELNSKLFNSQLFNSKLFNGTALAAAVERINGALTAAVHINGTPLTNIQFVSGSLLSAFDTGASATKIGAQLAGTVFKVNFDPMANGGEDLTFKITGVTQSAVQSDVYFYAVDALDEDDAFDTLCRDGAGNPTQAIALPGTWSGENAVRQAGSGRFTWACRGASLAKAVEWGYKPWASPTMNDAHQAAMRMIRADYFGNGVTHTTNGNPIDVSDKWGIQVADTNWPIEAKWGPNGAVCLSNPRKLWWSRANMPEAAGLPYCTHNGLANGTPNYDPSQFGGLLMTQVVPNSNPSAY
jgi:hypothetical protein